MEGKIYIIKSKQSDKVYIGSTTQSLNVRLRCHKKDYKLYLEGKRSFLTSFEIIKFEDCCIELLEEYPCENKNQLHKREGEFIKIYNCVNKRVAGRNQKERRTENCIEFKKKCQDYYLKNKERISDKNKSSIKCECGGCYTYQHKSRHFKTKKHVDYLVTII